MAGSLLRRAAARRFNFVPRALPSRINGLKGVLILSSSACTFVSSELADLRLKRRRREAKKGRNSLRSITLQILISHSEGRGLSVSNYNYSNISLCEVNTANNVNRNTLRLSQEVDRGKLDLNPRGIT